MSFYTQTSENMDSPRSQSPKQGLDVVAMADSVLLIYLEPARPKVNATFTFYPMRQWVQTKHCRYLKNLPNTPGREALVSQVSRDQSTKLAQNNKNDSLSNTLALAAVVDFTLLVESLYRSESSPESTTMPRKSQMQESPPLHLLSSHSGRLALIITPPLRDASHTPSAVTQEELPSELKNLAMPSLLAERLTRPVRTLVRTLMKEKTIPMMVTTMQRPPTVASAEGLVSDPLLSSALQLPHEQKKYLPRTKQGLATSSRCCRRRRGWQVSRGLDFLTVWHIFKACQGGLGRPCPLVRSNA